MAAVTVQSNGYFPNYSKDSIPVVHNVVSDKDLLLYNEENKGQTPSIWQLKDFTFSKIFRLLTDKHSNNLIERHQRAIKKFLPKCNKGIYLHDISIWYEILKACHEKITEDTRYEDLACALITILRKPFLKSKMSDEQSYQETVAVCLTDIGSIAEVSSEKIKVCVAHTMLVLYMAQIECNVFSSIDCKPVSSSFIKASFENSRICKSIAECFVQSTDEKNQLTILKSLNVLSKSDLNCDDILKTDAAASICCLLSKNAGSYKFLFTAVETLWNLLENGSDVEFSRQFSCDACLKSLLSTFIHLINNCPSHAERQLRNDLLVIIILVISKCPEAPAAESGISKMISVLSTYPELPTRNEQVRNVKIQPCPEDFELKKLLLCAIGVLANDPSSVSVIQQHHVLLGLFSFVQPIIQPLDSIWAMSEFEELQLHALSILSLLAPSCVNDFMTCQGSTRLLAVLDWCIASDEYLGHGNGFHGTGGRGSKRAQMRYCIRLIRSMCSFGDEQVCQDFTDQGLIAQIVAILKSCSKSVDNNDAVDIELQCDMLFIVATLCDGDVHRKELFGEAGVKMLVRYLDGYLNISKGPLNHRKLVLSATDTIWSSVINCFMNEVVFLENEGAFLLLDLLEVCPENMQNVVLGTILDLCENKNALPHILLWRGKQEKTVGKLLVDLWKNEGERLGVTKDPSAVIGDTFRPLMTKQQEQQGIIPLPVSFASPAVVDVSDNLRAKIYGMFSKMGFNNVPGLQPTDYIDLCVVEKYLDFKTMEVWQEIKKELELENIEPVSPDKECMDQIINMFEDQAVKLRDMQYSLIAHNEEQDLLDEHEYYDKIKDSHKQALKSYQDFVNFVDRTSDYAALKRVREKQLQMIDRSRLLSRGSSALKAMRSRITHETLTRSLATTTFCGRNILVRSTRFNSPIETSEQASEALTS